MLSKILLYVETLRFFLKKDELTPRNTNFFPVILSVSPPHKHFCSLFTLTKNIVKWQFEKILSQAPTSAYTIDKNKSVTRMCGIIYAVQTAETYLGFSKSVRRSRRKKPTWLCGWVHDAHLGKACWVVLFSPGVLNGTISVGWVISAQVLHQRSPSAPHNEEWHCLLNKFSFK